MKQIREKTLPKNGISLNNDDEVAPLDSKDIAFIKDEVPELDFINEYTKDLFNEQLQESLK